MNGPLLDMRNAGSIPRKEEKRPTAIKPYFIPCWRCIRGQIASKSFLLAKLGVYWAAHMLGSYVDFSP